MFSYHDSQSVNILLRFWNEPISIVILPPVKRVGRRLLSNIALAVIVHFDKVPIIRRKKESPGIPDLLWAFPGGKVEAGESFGRAVIREAAEETGPEGQHPALYSQIVTAQATYSRVA
jgi:8-oxo-dGTP pyrophosphatase MutT (NUDIX family)